MCFLIQEANYFWVVFLSLSCLSIYCYFQVITNILHLQGQKLNSYKGNYDLFVRTHDEQIENFWGKWKFKPPYAGFPRWINMLSLMMYVLIWFKLILFICLYYLFYYFYMPFHIVKPTAVKYLCGFHFA